MKKSKAVIFFFLFPLLQSLSLHQQNTPQDDRVKVDLYFQSVCPDSKKFIQGSLKRAANTKDFWKICDLGLYPYGNAKRALGESGWSFTCQHKEKECQGNMIQTCAINKYDLMTQALPFIICLEESTGDFEIQGQLCAFDLKLNWTLINSCAKSDEGTQLELQIALATEALIPPKTYVPWIVVNGVHQKSTEKAILKDMVSYVCSIYQGAEKIAACS